MRRVALDLELLGEMVQAQAQVVVPGTAGKGSSSQGTSLVTQIMKLEILRISPELRIPEEEGVAGVSADAASLCGIQLSNTSIGERFDSTEKDVFRYLRSLKVLDLSRNIIRSVGAGIACLGTTLLHLNLADNHITQIDDLGIAALRVLQRLDLSGNLLQHIPAGVRELRDTLKVLRLAGNKLSHLEEVRTILQPCRKLQSLSLFGNHFLLPNSRRLATDEDVLSFISFVLPQLRILDGEELVRNHNIGKNGFDVGPPSIPPPPPLIEVGAASMKRKTSSAAIGTSPKYSATAIRESLQGIDEAEQKLRKEYITLARAFSRLSGGDKSPSHEKVLIRIQDALEEKLQRLEQVSSRKKRLEARSVLLETPTQEMGGKEQKKYSATIATAKDFQIENEISAKDDELIRLTAELNATVETLDSAMKELLELEDKKRKEQEDLNQIREAKNEIEERHQEFLKSIERKRNEAQAELERVEIRLGAKNTEVVAAESNLAQIRIECEAGQAKLAQVTNEAEAQEERASKAQRIANEAGGQAQRLLETIEEQRRESELASDRLREIQSKIRERERALEDITRDIQELSHEQESLKIAVARAREEKSKIDSQIANESSNLGSLQAEIERVKSKFEALKEGDEREEQEHQQRLEEIRREHEEILAKIREHRDKESRIKKSREHTRKRINDLIEENKSLLDENKMLLSKHEEIKEVVTSASKQANGRAGSLSDRSQTLGRAMTNGTFHSSSVGGTPSRGLLFREESISSADMMRSSNREYNGFVENEFDDDADLDQNQLDNFHTPSKSDGDDEIDDFLGEDEKAALYSMRRWASAGKGTTKTAGSGR